MFLSWDFFFSISSLYFCHFLTKSEQYKISVILRINFGGRMTKWLKEL